MIFFIMWSLAMMIIGATAAAWYLSKPKFTSGSGIFIPPKDWKLMKVEMRAAGGGGSGGSGVSGKSYGNTSSITISDAEPGLPEHDYEAEREKL